MNILNFSLVAGWVDTLFDDCVLLIKDFAATFGMTYNEANIGTPAEVRGWSLAEHSVLTRYK